MCRVVTRKTRSGIWNFSGLSILQLTKWNGFVYIANDTVLGEIIFHGNCGGGGGGPN